LAWLAFAVLAPTWLGIDHVGIVDIAHAGDHTALHKHFGSYPLRVLAPLGFAAGLIGLLAARLLPLPPERRPHGPPRETSTTHAAAILGT
jgi:hypothetical protein